MTDVGALIAEELVAADEAPASVRDLASQALRAHGASWRDVSAVGRLRSSAAVDTETWFVAVSCGALTAGSEVRSQGRWARTAFRRSHDRENARTELRVHVFDAIGGDEN